MNAPPAMGMVNLSLVRFHPRNVRRGLGDLRELVASIEAVGVLQPISVDRFPDFLRLRAGHRRVAAARMAGLRAIPGIIHNVPLTDEQFIVGALHENLHRRNLDPTERAEAVGRLRAGGLSTADIALRLGVADSTVHRWASTTQREESEDLPEPMHAPPPASPPSRPAVDYQPRRPAVNYHRAGAGLRMPRAVVTRRLLAEVVADWELRLLDGTTPEQGRNLLRVLHELLDDPRAEAVA